MNYIAFFLFPDISPDSARRNGPLMGGRACTQLFADVKPFPETPPRSCHCTVSRPREVETPPPLPPAVPGANRSPGVSAGRTIRVGKGRPHGRSMRARRRPPAAQSSCSRGTSAAAGCRTSTGERRKPRAGYPRHHAPYALRVETYIALAAAGPASRRPVGGTLRDPLMFYIKNHL